MISIIKRADVFIQNLLPRVVNRLGFGYKEISKINPKLVMCSFSGYGLKGEYSNKKAYDALIQVETGLSPVTGPPDKSSKVGASICDISSGLTAFSEILKALMVVQRGGSDCHVESSLFGVMSEWMAVPLLYYEYGKNLLKGTGLDHPQVVPYESYETVDGSVFIVVQNQREWFRLCEQVLECPEIAEDPRYCSNEERMLNREALHIDFEVVFKKLPRSEVVQKFEIAGIAC